MAQDIRLKAFTDQQLVQLLSENASMAKSVGDFAAFSRGKGGNFWRKELDARIEDARDMYRTIDLGSIEATIAMAKIQEREEVLTNLRGCITHQESRGGTLATQRESIEAEVKRREDRQEAPRTHTATHRKLDT